MRQFFVAPLAFFLPATARELSAFCRVRTQSFRPRVRRLTFQAIAGGEEIRCHGGSPPLPIFYPSQCDPCIRAVIAITKRAFFTIGLRCPFCGQKSRFQNGLGRDGEQNLACKRDFFRAILLPDGRGAAWPYTRSGCSWHFAAQGARLRTPSRL